MIIVDTSVWVQHLRSGDDRLVHLLEAGTVLAQPWVHGELALGDLRAAFEVLDLLCRGCHRPSSPQQPRCWPSPRGTSSRTLASATATPSSSQLYA